MKPGEAALTDEQLQAAWRCMRRPATWPGTLEEALQDTVRSACIHGYARWLARFKATAGPVHSLPAAPVPPTPTRPPHRVQATAPARKPKAATGFDARKAAANDFD